MNELTDIISVTRGKARQGRQDAVLWTMRHLLICQKINAGLIDMVDRERNLPGGDISSQVLDPEKRSDLQQDLVGLLQHLDANCRVRRLPLLSLVELEWVTSTRFILHALEGDFPITFASREHAQNEFTRLENEGAVFLNPKLVQASKLSIAPLLIILGLAIMLLPFFVELRPILLDAIARLPQHDYTTRVQEWLQGGTNYLFVVRIIFILGLVLFFVSSVLVMFRVKSKCLVLEDGTRGFDDD
jgi:hypothetical protein